MRFSLHSQPLAVRSLDWLRQAAPPRPVRVYDPYEEAEVVFDAVSLSAVLDAVYGRSWRDEEELLFTCSDGYQPTLPVRRVLEHAAWLAFDRRDSPGFAIAKLESGALRQVALAPFYLVWENLDDAALKLEGDYGWPYQLVEVDLIRAADRFPHMIPPAGAPAAAIAGFSAFRVHCSRCHAVNGDGGQLGADLNRPVNPVEVREIDWLRDWIDDPSRILPTARMPRLNPALADRERVIDELIAYLRAMAEAKRTSRREGGGGG